MRSRILFLGTGGDEFVAGKQYRSTGGIIFNYDENQFHIDPGPSSLLMAKMANVNLRETGAILVTSNNLFTANDLNAVISSMTHHGFDKRGVLICPSTVVIDENRKKNPFLNKKYKNYLERTITIDNTNKRAVNDIDIEIIELKEQKSENVGYKFITPKFNLAYIPNTTSILNIETQLSDIDILILNITEPKDSQKSGVLNSNDAQNIINRVKPQLAIITGFGIKMIQADPLYEAREIQKNTSIQIIAAKDGMSINPISFAATTRQKHLSKF